MMNFNIKKYLYTSWKKYWCINVAIFLLCFFIKYGFDLIKWSNENNPVLVQETGKWINIVKSNLDILGVLITINIIYWIYYWIFIRKKQPDHNKVSSEDPILDRLQDNEIKLLLHIYQNNIYTIFTTKSRKGVSVLINNIEAFVFDHFQWEQFIRFCDINNILKETKKVSNYSVYYGITTNGLEQIKDYKQRRLSE